MSKFSLINVRQENNGFVDGVWIQNHVGTIEIATQLARETEQVNGNRIKVAVVEQLNFSSPNYSYLKNIKKLA